MLRSTDGKILPLTQGNKPQVSMGLIESYMNSKALESPKKEQLNSPEFGDDLGDNTVTLTPPRHDKNKFNSNTNTEPNNFSRRI